jgi:hypothetical protein
MPLTKPQVARLVKSVEALAINFGKAAGEELFLAFEMGLDDLPIDQIERAVRRAMRECAFMPTVMQVRELAGVVSDKDRSVLAWECVLRAIRKIGMHGSVDFDDPVINATVRHLGGWEKVSGVETDQLDWVRKAFEANYQACCRAGISQREARPLLSVHDAYNAANGFLSEVKPPLKIESGLPPHARTVLRIGKSEGKGLVSGVAADLGKRLGIEDKGAKP